MVRPQPNKEKIKTIFFIVPPTSGPLVWPAFFNRQKHPCDTQYQDHFSNSCCVTLIAMSLCQMVNNNCCKLSEPTRDASILLLFFSLSFSFFALLDMVWYSNFCVLSRFITFRCVSNVQPRQNEKEKQNDNKKSLPSFMFQYRR